MATMTVSTLMSHLAKAADIDVSVVASGSVNTTQGPNHWKYGENGVTYGGPVDCSGLIVAIARQVDSNYPRLNSTSFETMCPNQIGTLDLTTLSHQGAILWRSGHVCIYTGKGYTIEAFDPTYNVGRRGNRVPGSFTKWGYLDFVQY